MPKTIRLDDDVLAVLAKFAKPFESPASVVRRIVERLVEEKKVDFPERLPLKLGRGHKRCPECQSVNGSATRQCDCGHVFLKKKECDDEE